jgi:Ca2+-binding EF-hand superfamily protein
MAQVSLPSWQITSEVSELCYEKVAPSVGRVAQDEEECLRAAWKRLGVGKDGFLDRGELALLCECIGMQKVAEEVSVSLKRMLMCQLGRFYYKFHQGTLSI